MLTGSKEQAVYTPSEDPMYRHNPFIEALPPVLPMEAEWVRRSLLKAYSPFTLSKSSTPANMEVTRLIVSKWSG